MSKFYVAAAIPYVNDVPHVGHALEAVTADVLARYHRQQGDDVFFSYGTDEHGGKVLEKARGLKISPERYVDQVTQSFMDLTAVLNVEYSKFIRTTSSEHQKRAKLIWEGLSKDIYKGSYVGMYDQKEETFLSDEEAKEISQSDPERYGRLQKLEEENYFFKLSAYTAKVKAAIESGDMRIVPETRRNEILVLLGSGLEDISVSRPKDKLPWGIPVPNDSKQVIYVWFEALMNYITTLGYPDNKAFKTYWPCDVHVVGKDITRFHAAIWPAMLLALGLELPKSIYVHGFINIDGQKMSKSVGNVVSATEIVSQYGSEALRYYLLRHVPSHEDGDFTWDKFEHAYNGELGNDLGNLVQRTASMINRYEDGVIGEMPEVSHDVGPYNDALEDFHFDRALDYVWTLVRGLNQYIEEEKPWEIAKSGDSDHLSEVLAYIAASLVQLSELLWPFLPKTAEAIQGIFGEGVVKNYKGPLFPKIHNYTPAPAQ